MRIEGMSTVRTAIGRWAAAFALTSGLAITSPARADTWQDALRDADNLHDAAEDLHERALRLDDHRVIPVTGALDQIAANLYHELKHDPCAADVVPVLSQTEAVLNETSSAIAFSCDMHSDRKAIALLKDVRHHFVDTAEHIQCMLHDHHDHHNPTAAPPVRYSPPQPYSQPQPSWPASPFNSQYSPQPAWFNQPSPPTVWGSGYRGPSYNHSGHNSQRGQPSQNAYYGQTYPQTPVNSSGHRPLARVLISEVLGQ